MLLKIEAVAANESDSGIGTVTFGDPVRDLNRQRAKMSTTESMRVQIDALRIEKQQLEVENVRFREKIPEQGALIDKEAELSSDVVGFNRAVGSIPRVVNSGGMSAQALVWHYLLVRVVLVEGRSMECYFLWVLGEVL